MKGYREHHDKGPLRVVDLTGHEHLGHPSVKKVGDTRGTNDLRTSGDRI